MSYQLCCCLVLSWGCCIPTVMTARCWHSSTPVCASFYKGSLQQALKQQCAGEVEAVQQEVQHKQRQAARILKAKAEDEAIKVTLHTCGWRCPTTAASAKPAPSKPAAPGAQHVYVQVSITSGPGFFTYMVKKRLCMLLHT